MGIKPTVSRRKGKIPEDYLNIVLKLRALRGGLSQKEFAAKVGVPFGSYVRYETGERVVPLPVLQQIASQLKVPLSLVIADDEAGYDYMQFAEYLTSGKITRIIKGDALSQRIHRLVSKNGEARLLSKRLHIELFDRFLKILEEGDKDKLEAVRAQFKVLAP